MARFRFPRLQTTCNRTLAPAIPIGTMRETAPGDGTGIGDARTLEPKTRVACRTRELTPYSNHVPAEATQEQGRRALGVIKRWLEATTFIELQWNVYENFRYCQLRLLNGKDKRWDLAGNFLTGGRQQVFVENKDYSSATNLETQYDEFLANAYSATAHASRNGGDLEAHFIWTTTHPFAQGRWTELATREGVLRALEKYPSTINDEEPDQDLARIVADRTWVLVFNKKQAELSLDRSELDQVIAVLKRKESTL